MPDHSFIERPSLWFPFLIHSALLLVIAPVVYWLGCALLLGGWHFDFGTVLVLLICIPMSYPFFGFSLLMACAAATFSTVGISRFRSRWQRLTGGTLAGAAIGALLGSYIAMKLARDGAAIISEHRDYTELRSAGIITGAVLGLVFSGLWWLSCYGAGALSRGLAERTASSNGGPSTRSGSSELSEGPPSVG